MCRATTTLLLALLFAASLHAQTAPSSSPPPPPPSQALDLLEGVYKPLTFLPAKYVLHPINEDLFYPQKIAALATSESHFSRGTRELFFTWFKANCPDWIKDSANYIPSHGDVHLGNAGVYPSDIPTQQLSVGLVDFDESDSLPFQSDLLQALISLHLSAGEQGTVLTSAQSQAVAQSLFAAYRTSLTTGQTATESLSGEPFLDKLLHPKPASLRDEVDRFRTATGFKPTITSKKGVLKEILLPALQDADETQINPAAPFTRGAIAGGLSRACTVSPSFARLILSTTSDRSIKDAAIRVHLSSGGSQGLLKLLVYVEGIVKLPAGTTDALLYLKEESPASAAARAGLTPDPTSIVYEGPPTDIIQLPPNEGGRRTTGGQAALTFPPPDATSWCTIRDSRGIDHSFQVSLRDPWSGEPELPLKTTEDLTQAARYLGTLLGAAHHHAASPNAAKILARCTPPLRDQLLARTQAYLAFNHSQYESFLQDPRTQPLLNRAKTALSSLNPAPVP